MGVYFDFCLFLARSIVQNRVCVRHNLRLNLFAGHLTDTVKNVVRNDDIWKNTKILFFK